MARLYISKMKSEVKTLATRASNLDAAQTDNQKRLEDTNSELSECQLKIQQVCYEQRICIERHSLYYCFRLQVVAIIHFERVLLNVLFFTYLKGADVVSKNCTQTFFINCCLDTSNISILHNYFTKFTRSLQALSFKR